MRLRGCLRHLLTKKAPWLQGAWPLNVTHRVQRPRDKKGAAKKSLGLKKAPPCSLHRHDKTTYYLSQRCAGIIRSRLRVSKGLQ